MDAITHFLIDYGYWGMFISAFLAGSVLPFSSEAVMLGLLAAGVDPVPLLIYGSIGNVMGGMVNYGLGRLGKLEWLKKYFHLKQSSIDRAYKFMGGHGAWMGFFAFLPILGSAITVVLGLTRANLPLSVFSITLGKVMRYSLLIWGANLFM
ncbi:YqaA family protein [Prevotella veroralis]|uniref:SNARE-like domain protein n=1 Tax=Prevotella veroralis F0319 TaxID=649761 RepID=C9MLG8_9BACT|nr:YqaA family protein [Prevotella veroralis]EEX19502.1 SNARE-like domain protein [Prevotella veroralis F0319]QUB41829.1 DedA family protein [Prevotella veroralis]